MKSYRKNTKLLVENWKYFLKEEFEEEFEEKFEEKFSIGLVPMSAKPFHEGHMFLIREASKKCEKVIVFVSTSDRKRKGEITIFGEDMKYIWQSILQPSIESFYTNVEIEYGGSPVRKVFETLQSANEIISDETYYVYSDAEDTLKNYPVESRIRYFEDLYKSGKVKFAGEEEKEMFTRGAGAPDVSGTLMRDYLSNASEDKFLFLDSLPTEINAEQKEEIFNILFKRIN